MAFGFNSLFGDNPFSFGLGLLGNLLFAGDSARQEEEARQHNISLLRGGLGLNQAMGGLRPYDDPAGNLFGMPLQLPFDTMGQARQHEALGANRMGMDRQMATGRFNDFSKWLNEATQGRENRLLGEYDRGAGEVQGYAENRRDAVMDLLHGGVNDVQSRLGARTQDTLSGYANAFQDSYGQLQDRYTRGMANLEGMGEQARRDINERYDAQAGSVQQDLASRGLGNSTVLASMRMGNERERGGELGRLDESVRAQRLATDAALSGDVAAAKAADALNWSGLISGLRGDEANAAMSGTQMLGNAYAGLTGDVMGAMGNRFGNRMNLSSLLSGQTLGTAAGLREGGMNLQNAADSQLTNFLLGQSGYRMDQGNQANANYMNTLLGTNFAYPTMSPYQIMSGFGSARGGLEGTTDALNMQDKQFEQALTMSALSMGLNPLGSMMGGFGGGLGFQMGRGLF